MICKLCNKDIPNKFYLHLNNNHHLTKVTYLEMFPEQIEEYNKQIPILWNKGLTAKDHPSIAKSAKSMKEYSNRPEVSMRRSKQLKDRYAKGDILKPEVRKKVAEAGSQGWVKKLQQMTKEERSDILKNFTQAGNAAQDRRRPSLGVDDYNRLYTFAKGTAVYRDCHVCGKQMIVWIGGDTKKPRSKKKFCSGKCWKQYIAEHHGIPGGSSIVFASEKTGKTFHLRSWLEFCMAAILEEVDFVFDWTVPDFAIEYVIGNKTKKYYPDFLINGKFLVELKSEYMRKVQRDQVKLKLMAALKYCKSRSWRFFYLEFGSNMTNKKMSQNSRFIGFLETVQNDI